MKRAQVSWGVRRRHGAPLMLGVLRRVFNPAFWLGRRVERPPIVLTPDGFELRRGNGKRDMFHWAQAERVVAYKVDLVTTDEILVAFEYRDAAGGLMTFDVAEECPGFAEFRTALARAFPGIDTDWYAHVMKPAFATNLTVLYPA